MTRGWAVFKWLFREGNKSAPRLKPLLLISNHHLPWADFECGDGAAESEDIRYLNR